MAVAEVVRLRVETMIIGPGYSGLWLTAAAAMAVLTGFAFHRRRHEVRRKMHGIKVRGAGLCWFLLFLLIVLLAMGAACFVVPESTQTEWVGGAESGLHRSVGLWRHEALGLGLAGLVGICWTVFHRQERRRARAVRNTCPFCLKEGHIELCEADPEDEAYEIEMVRCSHRRSKGSHTEPCGYAFPLLYSRLPKLCFSVLGLSNAGKTVALTMLNRRLRHGDHSGSIRVERAEDSVCSAFDGLFTGMVQNRCWPAPTPLPDVPGPLSYVFDDRDRWGRSRVLVNLFDFGGEVMNRGVDDFRRHRALSGDGYLYFLDPTVPWQPQAAAFERFLVDLHRVRGSRAGRRHRAAMAICISKIDLLPLGLSNPSGGTDWVVQFYQQLSRLRAPNDDCTLDLVDARSRLIAELCEKIWPGWFLPKRLKTVLACSPRFFPMTVAGLDKPGEQELDELVLSPLGVLEPLLWMLHVNGYPTLG